MGRANGMPGRRQQSSRALVPSLAFRLLEIDPVHILPPSYNRKNALLRRERSFYEPRKDAARDCVPILCPPAVFCTLSSLKSTHLPHS